MNPNLTNAEKASMSIYRYPMTDREHRMNTAIKFHRPLNNFEEAVAIWKTGNYRFSLITDATDVKYFIMTNCNFRELGPEFSRKSLALAFRKNLPLTESFKNVQVVFFFFF